MTRQIPGSWLLTVALGLVVAGCQSGGVGDPCTPEDEYRAEFSGFDVNETNLESRSYQCETHVCLVNHFQGRTTCPYGQSDDVIKQFPTDNSGKNGDSHRCHIPGTTETINVPVDKQYSKRQTDTAVYCSCRCGGPDPNAKYCDCPSGFSCTNLVQDLGLGSGQLAGSYCVRDGTAYSPTTQKGAPCRYSSKDGDADYCGNDGVNP